MTIDAVASRATGWDLAVVSAAVWFVVDGMDASTPGTGNKAPTMAMAVANTTDGPTGAAERGACHLTRRRTARHLWREGTPGLYQTCIIRAQPRLCMCNVQVVRGDTSSATHPGHARLGYSRRSMVTDASHITGWAADPNALADFLEEPNLARLGTIDSSGEVHIVPAWYAWDGERLAIGADAADHKVANVRRTRRASVEIDSDLRRKRGILVHGPAVIIDGDEGRTAYEAISALQVRRYQPDRAPRDTAHRMAARGEPVVIEVRPERIISWGR